MALSELARRLGFLSFAQLLLYAALLFAIVASFIVTTIVSPEKLADWSVGAGALAIAAVTLYYVLPRPADLIASAQPELEIDDIIFYIYDEAGKRVPRDFLIQVHAAIANVGNQKGVLSRAEILEFLDAQGQRVVLPRVPMPLRGVQYVVHTGWAQGVRYFHNEEVQEPYVLDPNAAITLRFRARRGVEWGEKVAIEDLRAYSDALDQEVRQAKIRLSFRNGPALVVREFVIPITVRQQREYRAALSELTQDLTTVPAIAPRAIVE